MVVDTRVNVDTRVDTGVGTLVGTLDGECGFTHGYIVDTRVVKR